MTITFKIYYPRNTLVIVDKELTPEMQTLVDSRRPFKLVAPDGRADTLEIYYRRQLPDRLVVFCHQA